jgi:serine/threonine-protein kinase
MVRFLRLTVERSLAGQAGELKEYLLGVEVFDRKASYDPRVDPIVRVEARRLRSKLEFASGGYAPRVTLREAPRPQEPGGTTVAVLPFADLGGKPGNQYFSDGLTEELVHALTKVPGMRVIAWDPVAQQRERQQDVRSIGNKAHVGTVLTGSVRISDSSLRVRAQLIDAASGVYLWSETFHRRMEDVFAVQEEIALAIVRTLRVRIAGGGESCPRIN